MNGIMTVKKLIQKKGGALYFVRSSATVWEALEVMEIHNIGAVLILDEQGTLCGSFSERDYARKGILKGRTAAKTLVTELMTTNVITVRLDDTLGSCMRIMSNKHIRHLPVMEDNQMMGLITIRDVVKEIITDKSG